MVWRLAGCHPMVKSLYSWCVHIIVLHPVCTSHHKNKPMLFLVVNWKTPFFVQALVGTELPDRCLATLFVGGDSVTKPTKSNQTPRTTLYGEHARACSNCNLASQPAVVTGSLAILYTVKGRHDCEIGVMAWLAINEFWSVQQTLIVGQTWHLSNQDQLCVQCDTWLGLLG